MDKLKNNESNILNDYKNNISIRQLCKKYNSSYTTMQRFINKNNESSLNDSKNESLNKSLSDSKNESLNKSLKDESIESNNNQNEEQNNNSFDEMLNNIDIKINKEEIINKSIVSNKEKSKEIINDLIESKKNDPKIEIKKKSKIIKPKKISIKKSKNKESTSFIYEINCNDVEELKKKRSNIVIIRQYLNMFDDKLERIYGKDKNQFIKKLFNLTNEQLYIIIENIRVELSISRNYNIFNNVIETSAITFENILLKIFNIDVVGTFEDLKKNDPELAIELSIIACEYDITKYIDPKKMVFIKLLKTYYMKYKENKIINKKLMILIKNTQQFKINNNFFVNYII